LGAFVRRSKPQLFAIIGLCWLAGLAISSAYVHLRPDGIEHPDFNSIAFWIQVLKFNPLVRLPEFLTGMALGVLFLHGERNQKWSLPLVLVGAVGIGVVAYFAEQIPYVVINTGLLGPAFAAIVYGFALRPRWSAVLEHRFLVLCGDASYSFYLLHTMIILVLFHRVANGALQSTWLGFFLCQAITLGAALLVCQFIEKPARERLLRRRRPPVAVQQAVDTT
jgi:peptidoglycan/LPS O-acetylase OafA/YrhL